MACFCLLHVYKDKHKVIKILSLRYCLKAKLVSSICNIQLYQVELAPLSISLNVTKIDPLKTDDFKGISQKIFHIFQNCFNSQYLK